MKETELNYGLEKKNNSKKRERERGEREQNLEAQRGSSAELRLRDFSEPFFDKTDLFLEKKTCLLLLGDPVSYTHTTRKNVLGLKGEVDKNK